MEDFRESKIGDLRLLAEFKFVHNLFLKHLYVNVSVVACVDAFLELAVEHAVFESELGVLVDELLNLHLVEVGLRVQPQDLVFVGILC